MREEMFTLSGLSAEESEETDLSWVDVEGPGGRFQLWKRARHVFTEALRVKFRTVCVGAKRASVVSLFCLS